MAIEITEDHLRLAVLKLASLTGENQFVLIGRASLAVTAPLSLRNLAVSDDIDLWPLQNEKAALDETIDQCGEGSLFHQQYGFYIERLGAWTMLTQPPGWEERATELRFGHTSLLVLGLLDLAYNKLEANREKDREFLRLAFSEGLLTAESVAAFIETHGFPESKQTLLGYLASLVHK